MIEDCVSMKHRRICPTFRLFEIGAVSGENYPRLEAALAIQRLILQLVNFEIIHTTKQFFNLKNSVRHLSLCTALYSAAIHFPYADALEKHQPVPNTLEAQGLRLPQGISRPQRPTFPQASSLPASWVTSTRNLRIGWIQTGRHFHRIAVVTKGDSS